MAPRIEEVTMRNLKFSPSILRYLSPIYISSSNYPSYTIPYIKKRSQSPIVVEKGPQGPWSPEPIAVGTGWFNLTNKQTHTHKHTHTHKQTTAEIHKGPNNKKTTHSLELKPTTAKLQLLMTLPIQKENKAYTNCKRTTNYKVPTLEGWVQL